MEAFHCVKLDFIGFGLTNQLGFIISNIILAKLLRKRFVLIDNFNQSYNIVKTCPISNIIDIDALNDSISHLGITAVDKNNVTIKIISIKYGLTDNLIDITDELLSKCLVNGHLYIKKGMNLNSIKGDPVPCRKKMLFIKYQVNGITDSTIYDENLVNDINFNVAQMEPYEIIGWINRFDLELYDSILRSIKFKPIFYDAADRYMKSLNLTSKINVIHLRDDEDAINFWSGINKIPSFDFQNILINKYISTIQKYFDKDVSILVLTSNTQSAVLHYMRINGYKFHVCDKLMDGREMNAIVDLLIGECCNNIFIGGINPHTLRGSTFSYLVAKRIPQHTTKVMIDMDHIHDDIIVTQ